MSQSFELNQLDSQSDDKTSWLKPYYEFQKNRTLHLVNESIHYLLKRNQSITLSQISLTSKLLDPTGKGIHPNTVRNNPEAYEIFAQHSVVVKRKKKKRKSKRVVPEKLLHFDTLKPSRNLDLVQRRYNRMTKNELIQRLIAAEEYIIEHQQNWITEQFKAYKQL
jgi:isopropylmalate/homocitrate/citramalate synthase